MSRGLNKAMLIGNLGQDVEVRTTADGTKVATLSLATNETFKNKQGNKVTTTQWHRVTLWRGLAEIAGQYLRKGSKVYVEGSIQYSTYEKDGVTKYSTDIVATELTMLDGAPESDGGRESFVPINER